MLFGLVVLAAVLARAQTQIVPANLPSTQLCSIPEETVRVLPSSGFSRGVWDSWTATQLQSPAGPDATLAAYANCLFWSFDPSFESLLGADPVIMQVGPTTPTTYTYTETPAYLPDTNELVFSSVEAQWSAEIGTSAPNNMSRLSLTTGELVPIPISPPPGNLGGASYYKKDGAGMVVVAGLGDANDAANPPAIYLLDPVTGNYTILVNNWFGQRFGGFDDVIAMADGSIIMTDTNFTTGAMPPFSVNLGGAMPYAVWILPGIGGPPRPLIGHTQIPNNPNGLALNEDETVLYVSCSSLTGTMDTNAEAAVNQVFAFDLLERQGGYFAANQRLFAESDYGFVDGFKSDALGNIYGSTSDGVSVWNAAGTLIGKVLIPTTKAIQQHPTSAIGFANSSLVIMHNTGVLLLPLNTTEAAFVAND